MKRILLFGMILFAISLMAQPRYLQGSDSLLHIAPQEKYVKLSIIDSLDSSTDTCKVYVETNTGEFLDVACQDLLTGEIVTELIPGNGNKGRYLINEPFPTAIIIERTNTLNRSRRTTIWVSSVGSY